MGTIIYLIVGLGVALACVSDIREAVTNGKRVHREADCMAAAVFFILVMMLWPLVVVYFLAANLGKLILRGKL